MSVFLSPGLRNLGLNFYPKFVVPLRLASVRIAGRFSVFYRSTVFVCFCVSRFFRHLVCVMKKSKKSDSAAASAASSSRTTSSFSKSVVSPLIPTTPVSEILVSQSLGTLGHFGVPSSVIAGVTDHVSVSSSTTRGVAGLPLVGCSDTVASVVSEPQCVTGHLISVPSSATREEGRATGLYPSGVYPCSVSLGFRGSPTPRPQLDATPQPSSSMHGLFRSFMDCVSAFNPSFAANLAPSPARRVSIPAALGAPPSVSLPASAPFSFDRGARAPTVSAPFSSPHLMGQEDPLAALSRTVSPHPHTVVAFCVPLGVFPVRLPVGFHSGFRGAG